MPNIAVLIDAENVDPSFANQVFSYAEARGTIIHKEIYGAGIALNEWADPILQHAIHMHMTLRPNRFKNSSDIALVIGAMDLVAERAMNPANGVDTVVLASSDSDFSALSLRLRTAGIEVVGMGNPEKANPMWPKACSIFVPLKAQPQSNQSKEQPAQPKEQPEKKADKTVQPQPAQRAKKEKAPKVNPSHNGRVSNIKKFITAQLDAHEGKMTSNALFNALNELADYKYDQQRSKRKPLDYLTRQLGDAIRFEEDSDGTVWIQAAAKAPAPAAEPATEETIVTEEAAIEETAVEEAPAAEEPTPAPVPVEEAEKPAPAPAEETFNPVQLFLNDGLPEGIARQIVNICDQSTNLKTAYDKLRKAFGAKDGRTYYQLVKKHTSEQKA